MYTPFNYDNININAGSYSPSSVKSFNNKTFEFWERALFQRAQSVLLLDLPDVWQGAVKDFFYYCLFKFGNVTIFETEKFGNVFQPGALSGTNFYYQPTTSTVSNPLYSKELTIGKDCEVIKLTPDYRGIWDIIQYYAEKLSTLDNAINMSLVNQKFSFIWGARNKTAGAALKKILDLVNKGEPAVIYDMNLLNDTRDKAEPFQMFERSNMKSNYITTDQLMDFQTILNNFDTEIGIPVLPYQKKERMVTSEAESKIIDATSRSIVWLETLNSSFEVANKHYAWLNAKASLRYDLSNAKTNDEQEVEEDEQF